MKPKVLFVLIGTLAILGASIITQLAFQEITKWNGQLVFVLCLVNFVFIFVALAGLTIHPNERMLKIILFFLDVFCF